MLKGLIAATLPSRGTLSVTKQQLIRTRTELAISSKLSFIKSVGIGSKRHVVDLDLQIKGDISEKFKVKGVIEDSIFDSTVDISDDGRTAVGTDDLFSNINNFFNEDAHKNFTIMCGRNRWN